MRLIQITNGVLALPEYGDPRFCDAYDEDCDGVVDKVWCAHGAPKTVGGKLYSCRPLMSDNPCPYLD